jgi:hypothetical protein
MSSVQRTETRHFIFIHLQNAASALPTRFTDTRDLAAQAQEPKTNSAHTKPPQEAAHAAAQRAPVVGLCRKLRFAGRLVPQR